MVNETAMYPTNILIVNSITQANKRQCEKCFSEGSTVCSREYFGKDFKNQEGYPKVSEELEIVSWKLSWAKIIYEDCVRKIRSLHQGEYILLWK